jgi:hypothetical protein
MPEQGPEALPQQRDTSSYDTCRHNDTSQDYHGFGAAIPSIEIEAKQLLKPIHRNILQ